MGDTQAQLTEAVRTTAGERVVANPLHGQAPVWSPYTRAPLDFHRRLPGYAPTALLRAPSLAARLGVRDVLIKAETARFGLPAFKMLGASWATYRALVERIGVEPVWDTVADLAKALEGLRPFALAAATDGNHGRAVAAMARMLGLDARIFVPEGTVPARIEAIADEGATVFVVEGDYDAAVARAAEEGGPACLVISDTSWPGYEQVPHWVVEGYSTLLWEIDDALARDHAHGEHEVHGAQGVHAGTLRGAPDAVIVPMGVGALCGAVVNHWCRQDPPAVVVGVEPVDAACVMASALAGGLTSVPGPHRSIMVGLNCGTPSPVAWPLVSTGVRTLVAAGDDRARQAVRDLAALGVEAGETGAAALAGLTLLQASDQRLSEEATVVVLCTEGATDPEAWWRILGVEVL